MSILISIDTTSRTPLYRQIVDRISAMATSGNLKPGTRLPSSRDLAQKLGLNRSTVYRAYQELWAMGYLESRPGSYTTLRCRPPVVPRTQNDTPPRIDCHHVGERAAAVDPELPLADGVRCVGQICAPRFARCPETGRPTVAGPQACRSQSRSSTAGGRRQTVPAARLHYPGQLLFDRKHIVMASCSCYVEYQIVFP